MEIKVGDSIYLKREGNRYYTEYIVKGETSRSWLVLHPEALEFEEANLPRYAKKIPKSGTKYHFGTKFDAALAEWAGKHRHNIQSAVYAVEAPMLLKIAKLIGYDNLPVEE